MTPEQKARVEANRKKALERLKKRGILNKEQAKTIASRNAQPVPQPVIQKLASVSPSTNDLRDQNRTNINGNITNAQPSNSADSNMTPAAAAAAAVPPKRPLEKIRPSIRMKDYIEYDFSTMQNSNGGYINPQDRLNRSSEDFDYNDPDFLGSKKQKTLDDWKREQRERKAIYENMPPPEHISLAPKCVECQINIEMDPVLNDVFKLQVCKSCAKEHPEKYSLLTKTECKEDYFLTDPELNDEELFHRLEKPNPHSGTFARMQLFVRCEIEAFAFKKWDGEDGLDKEWQRREEGKSMRREKKYQQQIKQMRIKTRAQEYTKKLLEKKHGILHVHEFSEPMNGGKDEDGNDILRRRCVGCGLETEEVSI
ncbi:DNA repair protein RAD14 NDAI_0I00630 [Naumovozyma dairenensis CBS 421]|uniref:DNA repair protein RAD14 n=1 Tax=Naumovozyma dairenensis (strain ATCC 10597 / BCRC 20456 / CBS 421 / NBRC 0211 / NRRL Y-12639) TaxID=1071378 RepID=G0WFS1_NAUDC|nr:hypothetical protein NDAI_0I00630 [Naumovozyma dairenensis CBS 421]CCD26632.1 hypothetical protein NDAI_0I00630 [Naumovozyma dairenensis CBS 421]